MKTGSLVGNKYRLTKPIGEGAMGVVWAAVNELTSREVALKLILRSTDDLRIRLMREARACGSISHRNIIEVLDVGQTETGDPFLVMPLLSGETLAELLARQRRVEPSVAAQIGRDVARALAAAHAANIIHRDLKPANIFLHREAGTEGNIVKVLDFGVSKNLSSTEALTTVVGGAVGSPAYMSPEQVRVDRDIDFRTDLWSLGVVLFEMLTGTRPFQGESTEVIGQVLAGPIPRVSSVLWRVDEGLDKLVARCLERSRDRRVGSAAELAKLLNGYVTTAETSQIYADLPVRPSSPELPGSAAPISGYVPPSTQAGGFHGSGPPVPTGPAYDVYASQAGGLAEIDEGDIATVPVDIKKLGNLRRAPAPPAAAPPSPAAAAPVPHLMPSVPAPSQGYKETLPTGTPRPNMGSYSGGVPGFESSGLPSMGGQPVTTEPLPKDGYAPWRAQTGTGMPRVDAPLPPPSTSSPTGKAGTMIMLDPRQPQSDEMVGGGTLKMSPDMLPNLRPLPPSYDAPPPPHSEKASTTSAAAVVSRPADAARSDPSRLSSAPDAERSKKRNLILLGVGSASVMMCLVVAGSWLLTSPGRGPTADSPGTAAPMATSSIAAPTTTMAPPEIPKPAEPQKSPEPPPAAAAEPTVAVVEPPIKPPATPTAKPSAAKPATSTGVFGTRTQPQPTRKCSKLIKTNCVGVYNPMGL